MQAVPHEGMPLQFFSGKSLKQATSSAACLFTVTCICLTGLALLTAVFS